MSSEDTIDLRTVASSIATALGPEWSVVPPDQDHRDPWFFDLIRSTDDVTLFLEKTWPRNGKLDVKAYPPKAIFSILQRWGDVSRYTSPTAGMSVSRGPEILAREIRRRVLDDFPPILERAQAKAQEIDQACSRTQAHISALHQAAPDVVTPSASNSPEHYSGQLHIFQRGPPQLSGDLQVSSSGSVDIKLSGVPVSRAVSLLRHLFPRGP